MIEFPSGDSSEDECILHILNLVMDEIEVYHREADLCEQSNPLSCPLGLQTTSVKTGHKCQAAAGVWGGKVTLLQPGFCRREAVAAS